jgi:hypothetical protein
MLDLLGLVSLVFRHTFETSMLGMVTLHNPWLRWRVRCTGANQGSLVLGRLFRLLRSRISAAWAARITLRGCLQSSGQPEFKLIAWPSSESWLDRSMSLRFPVSAHSRALSDDRDKPLMPLDLLPHIHAHGLVYACCTFHAFAIEDCWWTGMSPMIKASAMIWAVVDVYLGSIFVPITKIGVDGLSGRTVAG